jgi:hypothetical protein
MLSEEVKEAIKDAAKKLTGYRKREFIAKVTEDYFNGSARKAESEMGWKRTCMQTGLHERRRGLICMDNYGARGRLKSEEKLPKLEADIKSLKKKLLLRICSSIKISGFLPSYCPNEILRFSLIDWYFILPCFP